MKERKCAQCGQAFPPNTPNQKYCKPDCYRQAMARRQRAEPRLITCAHDDCHTFKATNSQAKFCPGCQCARKHRADYQRRREEKPELFEEPREFKLHPIRRLPNGTSVLIIGDIHHPFADGPTLTAVERFWNHLSPDIEIYNGDIFDFYSISSFDKNPTRAFDFKDEIDIARAWLRKRVKKNPFARRIFIEGNHEDRLRTWLWKKAPELAKVRGMSAKEQLELDELGFTHLNYRSRLDILGMLVEHGYRASRSDTALPMNVARLMGLSTQSSGVCGHSHGLNTFRWRDARGSHSYREGGCLCKMNLEYAPFPTTWAWGFVHGIVRGNKLYLTTVPIYEDGFEALGKFYPRV